MELSELQELCKDRELVTPEIHTPNDFYGHASVIKKYCNLPDSYQIKACIEHAPTLGDFAWGPDLQSELPTILTFAEHRFEVFRKSSAKTLFAIGAPILYAQSIYSEQQRQEVLKKVGRCLLVFPSHSSHFIQVQYDINDYCRKICELGKNFDSVRVCIYWKDALADVNKIYQSYGFECVSAGHMFDPLFLSRLRAIIETSHAATGYEAGTAVGYCIALNCPFFFTPTSYNFVSSDPKLQSAVTEELDKSKIFYNTVEKAFGTEYKSQISEQEKKTIEYFWGLSSQRSPQDLTAILEITEEMYQLSRQNNISNFNFLFHRIGEYIKSNQGSKALIAINELEKSDPNQSTELPILRAAANLQMGRIAAAIILLEDFLNNNPGNQTALNLLQVCKSTVKL